MQYFFQFLQAFLLSLCVSADVFIVSLEYSAKKINISLKSIVVFNLVCCALMAVFMLIAVACSDFISENIAKYIGFTILLIIGIWKILEDLLKGLLNKISKTIDKLEFSFFSFSFILKIYSSPEKADVDASSSISSIEAAILSIALSVDAVTAGFSEVISGDIHPLLFIICTFITGCLSWIFGKAIGQKLASHSLHMSLFTGIVITAFAFSKLFMAL